MSSSSMKSKGFSETRHMICCVCWEDVGLEAAGPVHHVGCELSEKSPSVVTSLEPSSSEPPSSLEESELSEDCGCEPVSEDAT